MKLRRSLAVRSLLFVLAAAGLSAQRLDRCGARSSPVTTGDREDRVSPGDPAP
jgi:hypothetical protein